MAKREVRFNSDTFAQHVCLKGHNSSSVFFDDSDRALFLEATKTACEEYDVKLLIYALMDNHIHMILHGDVEQFQFVFESIGANYAREFNQKAGGSGAVWQKRYYTVAIQTPDQFLKTAAYIFYNPVEVGLCENPQDYEWSNFSEIVNDEIDDVKDIIDKIVRVEHLIEYTFSVKDHKLTNREAAALGLKDKKVHDEELFHILSKYVHPHNFKKVAQLDKQTQQLFVKEMWDYGANVHQISRVTNIGRYVVKRIIGT